MADTAKRAELHHARNGFGAYFRVEVFCKGARQQCRVQRVAVRHALLSLVAPL